MKAKRHTHKYHRVELAFGKVWACALPNCNHYMPVHLEELVPGKSSLCWNCEERFTLDPINMKHDKPECNDCKPKEDIAEFIEQVSK